MRKISYASISNILERILKKYELNSNLSLRRSWVNKYMYLQVQTKISLPEISVPTISVNKKMLFQCFRIREYGSNYCAKDEKITTKEGKGQVKKT